MNENTPIYDEFSAQQPSAHTEQGCVILTTRGLGFCILPYWSERSSVKVYTISLKAGDTVVLFGSYDQ